MNRVLKMAEKWRWFYRYLIVIGIGIAVSLIAYVIFFKYEAGADELTFSSIGSHFLGTG